CFKCTIYLASSVPAFNILLHLPTYRVGSCFNIIASCCKFHCAGKASPVSDSLIPQRTEIFWLRSLNSFSAFTMESWYGPFPYLLNKAISASERGAPPPISFFSSSLVTGFLGSTGGLVFSSLVIFNLNFKLRFNSYNYYTQPTLYKGFWGFG